MNRLVLSILISLLAGCATPSPVRQFFDQQNFQYPVEIAPARSKTPLLADINSEPAERLAPEHESFFADGVKSLRSLATYRKLHELSGAEAFVLGPPYLLQDSPEVLCLAMPFSAYQVGPISGEIHLPIERHSVGEAEVVGMSNILLLCPSGDEWELLCCSI